MNNFDRRHVTVHEKLVGLESMSDYSPYTGISCSFYSNSEFELQNKIMRPVRGAREAATDDQQEYQDLVFPDDPPPPEPLVCYNFIKV